MRQSLPIEDQSFTALHGIIDVEVLHAQNIFIDIELAKVPARLMSNNFRDEGAGRKKSVRTIR